MGWLLFAGNEIRTSWKSQTKWALIKELRGISKVRADCPKSRKLLPGATERVRASMHSFPYQLLSELFTSCLSRTSPFPQMTDKRENYEHECVQSKPQNLHINPVISCYPMKEMFRDKFLTLSLCDVKNKLAFFLLFLDSGIFGNSLLDLCFILGGKL